MGGFDLNDVTQGRLAMFNMWDYERTLENIQNLDCESQGNLLTMSNLSIGGPANFTMEDVPCETSKSIFINL